MKSQLGHIDLLGIRLVKIVGSTDGGYKFALKTKSLSKRSKVTLFSVNLAGIKKYFFKLKSFESMLVSKEAALGAIEARLIYQQLEKKLLPQGGVRSKRVMTSSYGYRTHPISGKKQFHHGLDYAAKQGTPIFAVADGVVSSSERRTGYGNIVEIAHGKFSTLYAHNQKNLVMKGQKIRQGQRIALVGKTGKVTGSHVHFEVLNVQGKTTNPFLFIKKNILDIKKEKMN